MTGVPEVARRWCGVPEFCAAARHRQRQRYTSTELVRLSFVQRRHCLRAYMNVKPRFYVGVLRILRVASNEKATSSNDTVLDRMGPAREDDRSTANIRTNFASCFKKIIYTYITIYIIFIHLRCIRNFLRERIYA